MNVGNAMKPTSCRSKMHIKVSEKSCDKEASLILFSEQTRFLRGTHLFPSIPLTCPGRFFLNTPGKLSLKEKWALSELRHMHLECGISIITDLTKPLCFLSPTPLILYSVGVTSPTYCSKSLDFYAHLWIIEYYKDVKSQTESKFRN